ncbi:hypothetical protein [Comamonas sp.]|uniref:hypothetical protein n=1 Tax=Comamonas sp. TaxID=34028 RepID=UPI0028974B63|nr:hypothetical protein [Comamonas sp.]
MTCIKHVYISIQEIEFYDEKQICGCEGKGGDGGCQAPEEGVEVKLVINLSSFFKPV